jgi:MFS family permease
MTKKTCFSLSTLKSNDSLLNGGQNIQTTSLTKKQKEAIGLLQVGTFLEYFDLMLYVHMAVLLNELFFPKTDPHTTALLSAFAFCSTYVLRPFGALIFGYIGDNLGRKTTVIITTTIMSISCVIMANLSTYAQIGIAASWIVTICRITQGLSSMGEIIGAQIYVTEITKPPAQYPAVAFISVASAFGAVAALGIASLVTHFGFNWRLAFWIGAGIAVVGSIARTQLRETPEFLTQIKKKIDHPLIYRNDPLSRTSKKTFLALFLIYCGWPLSFYLVFIHFNAMLSHTFHYSPEDIIFHNFLLSIVFLTTFIIWALLSYRVYPLKIIKVRGVLCIIITFFLPWLIDHCKKPEELFLLQSTLLFLSLASTPTESILVSAVPVLRRFTAASCIYALSRALIYVVTSFSLVYLTEMFGNWGLWIVIFPIAIGFLWGTLHFEKIYIGYHSHLEK